MGSKNFIAKWVIDNLPCATTFVDLFAGGCAVTHAALLSGKYKRFIANDINDTPKLFLDAIAGKYRNECHWISREEFFARKDTDAYIRTCWSFGNNGSAYIYMAKTLKPFVKHSGKCVLLPPLMKSKLQCVKSLQKFSRWVCFCAHLVQTKTKNGQSKAHALCTTE